MGAAHLEKREHGDRCKRGDHLHYRVRKPDWVEIRCKLCKHLTTELYEDSFLTMREEMAA